MNVMYLTQLDKLQGTDPDRLKMREHMPEPSNHPTPRITVLKPVTFNLAWNPSDPLALELPPREEFIKHFIKGPGLEFVAWQSLSDGKTYI